MLKIENTEVYGWEAAIRGMRNPKNSWDKSDSVYYEVYDDIVGLKTYYKRTFEAGEKDLALMKGLAKAGNDHGKFMRMITVTFDVTAPFYWWKEADTYKVGTVANSCSTMHKLTDKKFELDDFSHEHLTHSKIYVLERIIDILNIEREKFLETGDKECWWQMIQLLPSSYNQRRTVQMNYAVLKNIYHARKNHKLDEWHTFCEWIESLPYSELITEK